jgi:site-specific DNA recombinase
MYEELSGESTRPGDGQDDRPSPPRRPPTSRLEPPLRAKDGERLQVLGIARISTVHQDALSLKDQEALYRHWLDEHTDLPYQLTMIASQGSGELLDRKELRQAEELVESGRQDLVLAEDLGRISRRIYAASFCELCEDFNTRLVAINDHVDTAKEDWRLHSFFATFRHESYNRDTAKRIRRTSRNRFLQGGMVQTVIFCYCKPPGMKTDEQLEKIPDMAPFVEGMVERLEKDWTYSEVADWLNNNNVPLGKWCRTKKWTGAMVRRIVFNPILKGVREHNRKVAKRVNETGRRKSVNAPPEELLERSCPHLAFIESARYDRLIAKLREKNAHYAVGRRRRVDPRLGRPKKRTIWPGQHVTCGVCGRPFVYGGHGRTKYLICSGARFYQCWNGATFDAIAASAKMATAIFDTIAAIPDFDPAFVEMVHQQSSHLDDSRCKEIHELERRLLKNDRELDNLMASLKDLGGSARIIEEIKSLESERKRTDYKLQELRSLPTTEIVLPSAKEITLLGRQAFQDLAHESHEFAKLMKKLIPTINVKPVRCIDQANVHLRAFFDLSLAKLITDRRVMDAVEPLLRRELVVDLFDPPQRVAYRQQVIHMRAAGMTERAVAKQLGLTTTATQRAAKLNRLMVSLGINDPYVLVTEPDPRNTKLRRHLHPRYRFEPLPGFGGE